MALPLNVSMGRLTLDGQVPTPSFNAKLQTTLVPELALDKTPTFTRATTAYVKDFEGLYKLCKINEARFTGARRVENKLTFSEDFSNAIWLKSNCSVVANDATSNDNTLTADTVTTTTTAAQLYYDAIAVNSSGTYVFSWWAKLGTATAPEYAIYDVTNAAFITASTAYSATTSWKRFSVSIAIPATCTSLRVYPIRNVGTTGTITMDRAQVEDVTGQANLNPSEYVSVSLLSAPFHGCGIDAVKYFEYQNGNTVASLVVTEAQGAIIAQTTLLGFLSESARTNLCLRSQEFDNATWTKNNTTIVANNVVSPDGLTTADRLVEAALLLTHNVEQSITKAASALAYTFTVFLKSGEKTKARIYVDDGAGNGCHADVNMGAGTIGAAADDGTAFTVLLSDITSEINGWYRAELMFKTNTATTLRFRVAILDASDQEVYLGVITDGIYVWQAQVEQREYSTSIIPTTSATVTRNLDRLTFPIKNINSQSGGIYYESRSSMGKASTSGAGVFGYSMNMTSGWVAQFGGTNGPEIRSQDGTSLSALTSGSSFKTQRKVAFIWGFLYRILMKDGVMGARAAFDGLLFSLSETIIIIGSDGTSAIDGEICNVIVWPKAIQLSYLKGLTSR